MDSARKLIRFLRRLFLLAGLSGLAAVFGYLFLTPAGSWRLCRAVLSRKLENHSVTARRVDGSILTGLRLSQVMSTNLPKTPRGTELRIRLLSVSLPILDLRHPSIIVRDGRLDLPDSEPVLISGEYREGRMHLNLYSRMLDTREVLGCFLSEKDARKFSGPVGPLDLDWTGPLEKLEVQGVFQIQQLNYYTFALVDAAGTLALTVRPGSTREGLIGEVRIERGILNLKNCSVKMEASRIIYAGDPKQPVFDLAGTALIEKIPVRVVFKGTFRRPELRLSSDPPLPQEQLLLMLATGKRWRGMEGVSQEGGLPLDLVGDFLDFAVFGGTGSHLAQRLGVQGSLLVTDNGRTTGVGVRKSVSDRVDLRYGVEQTQPETGEIPTVRQKVGAELEVTPTDRISVEAESEVVPSQEKVTTGSPKKEPERSGKVLLKYKKKF